MQHTKISNIGNDINTLLFPRVCFGCNARLYRGEYVLCTFCRDQIPLTEQNYLLENAVDRIFYGRCRIEKAAAFLYYSDNGMVRNLIHYLKYKRQQVIGEFMGNWFGSEIANQDGVNQVDFVLPVPLHPRKLRRRGYNQVSKFAEGLAHHLNAALREDLLIKTANTKTQTAKGRLFRTAQSKSLYTLTNPEVLSNAVILIADDVITTGATMEACCLAFKNCAGIKIYLAAIAFVP